MEDDYKLCLIVNLLAKNKEHEEMLTSEVLNQLRQLPMKSVKYYYFDFHYETRGDNYSSLDSKFIKDNQTIFSRFDYFVQQSNNNKVFKTQQGVFRTNCLDCLDRTNVI
jgi:hypothetical protein